jgi:methylglutaconyl-CoA hydratase
MLFLLKRVSETHAKDLLLTARMINADDACKMGFINQSVQSNELDDKVNEIAQMLMKNSGTSLKLTKEMFANIAGMDFEKALEYACDLNAVTRMTPDCKNGVANFLSKQKP